MLKPYVLLLAFASALPARAQIVNIEARRLHTDSVRFAGRANASFSVTQNNQRTLYQLNGDGVLQAKSRNLRHIYLLVGARQHSRGGGQEFANAWLGHARYNYKLSRLWRFELFQQLQQNRPLGVRLRSLSGAGPRLKLVQLPAADVYFGSLYMYEYEEMQRPGGPGGIEREHRLSAYLSFSLDLASHHLTLISTTYCQPALRQWADYRLLTENRLEVRLWKALRLFTNFRYLYDSRPVEGVKPFALGFEQGMGLQF